MATQEDGVIAESTADLQTVERHLLQDSWVLWFKPSGGWKDREHWKEKQILVHEFFSVEEFWSVYNNICGPSKMGTEDYSVFKSGVSPDWDHPPFDIDGGRWTASVDPKVRCIDDIWMYVCLAMIGENFGDLSKYVCGAVVATRPKQIKLSIWLSNSSSEIIQQIGSTFWKVIHDACEHVDNAKQDGNPSSTPHTIKLREKEFVFERFSDKTREYLTTIPKCG